MVINSVQPLLVQAAVLLLFNAAERLSYNDIKNQLNLTDEDIVRLLHSLSCAKYKILNKDPSTKSVQQNDFFEFNTKFTDKMRRIKVRFLVETLYQITNCGFPSDVCPYCELLSVAYLWESSL